MYGRSGRLRAESCASRPNALWREALRPLLALPLITVTLGINSGCVSGGSAAHEILCGRSETDPAILHVYDDFRYFRTGGIAQVDGAWVVAGMETTREDAHGLHGPGAVRALHSHLGDLSPTLEGEGPHGPGTATLLALDHDRWGLVWGEAVPPGEAGDWPPWAMTKLWLSERYRNGWLPPTEIASARRIFWDESGTIRHFSGETYLMTAASESGPTPPDRILFGSVRTGLRPVPIPSDVRPLGGGFDVDDKGKVTALVLAERTGVIDFLLVISGDRGDTWSDPVHIRRIPPQRRLPMGLRVHRDADHHVHIFWEQIGQNGSGGARHVMLAPDGAFQKPVQVPSPPGVLLRWATGRDGCGQITMAKEMLMPLLDGGVPALQVLITKFLDGRWTKPVPLIEDYHTAYLIDGLGSDGSWYVGGIRWPSEITSFETQTASALPVSVWGLAP